MIFKQYIDELMKSGKPHHIITAFLLLAALSISAYAIAQQEKLDNKKADNQTIQAMLKQNQELIDLYRLSQQAQMQESMALKRQVEEEQRRLNERVNLLSYTQEVNETTHQLRSDAILDKLDALSKQMEALSKKIE